MYLCQFGANYTLLTIEPYICFPHVNGLSLRPMIASSAKAKLNERCFPNRNLLQDAAWALILMLTHPVLVDMYMS